MTTKKCYSLLISGDNEECLRQLLSPADVKSEKAEKGLMWEEDVTWSAGAATAMDDSGNRLRCRSGSNSIHWPETRESPLSSQLLYNAFFFFSCSPPTHPPYYAGLDPILSQQILLCCPLRKIFDSLSLHCCLLTLYQLLPEFRHQLKLLTWDWKGVTEKGDGWLYVSESKFGF